MKCPRNNCKKKEVIKRKLRDDNVFEFIKLKEGCVISEKLNIDGGKISLDASDALALSLSYIQMNCR